MMLNFPCVSNFFYFVTLSFKISLTIYSDFANCIEFEFNGATVLRVLAILMILCLVGIGLVFEKAAALKLFMFLC